MKRAADFVIDDAAHELGTAYNVASHCSGETFIAAAQAAMPGKVIRSIVGTRYLFGRA